MIEFIEYYSKIWAENFGVAVLQHTLFLGIVFLALYWLKGANAKTKYIIAIIGISKLMVPLFVPVTLLSRFFTFSNPMIEVQVGAPMMSASTNKADATFKLSLIRLCFVIWFFVVVL